MSTPTRLKPHLKGLDDLPVDRLLGRIVLFTITEEPTVRADLVRWFADLGLDQNLVPAEDTAVNAFKKATTDTKDTYPLAREREAYLMCRDVTSNKDYIRRQITREEKNAPKRKLDYVEAISCTFYRALRTDDQSSARLEISVNPSRLADEELPHVRLAARQIKERYDYYLTHLDSAKIRAMVRAYLKRLNAIEIKGGVYFVHVTRDDELDRLSELVGRLGGGCHMDTIPVVDTERERRFIVRNFEREAAQTLRDLTKEITEIGESRKEISPTAYSRLKSRYDEVLANAEEHMLTLQISQDTTAASAEVALKALSALQDRMIEE